VKGLICIVVTAAAAAMFAPAVTASRPGTVINVDASFTVPYTFNSVADAEVDLTSTRVNLGPHLGSFIISGYVIVLVPDCLETDPSGLCTLFHFERNMNLVFTAGNADQLALAEDVAWLSTDPVPSGTWEFNSAATTGKYEGYSGSGVHTMDFSVPGKVTISLSGTLTTS
jgi:hypothetical protein